MNATAITAKASMTDQRRRCCQAPAKVIALRIAPIPQGTALQRQWLNSPPSAAVAAGRRSGDVRPGKYPSPGRTAALAEAYWLVSMCSNASQAGHVRTMAVRTEIEPTRNDPPN